MRTIQTLLGIFLISAAAAPVEAESAGRRAVTRQCYDFSRMTPGQEFQPEQTLDVRGSTINLHEYYVEQGVTSQADEAAKKAKIQNSRIAGGDAPELRTNLVNVQVVPDSPVRKASLKFGRTGGARFANLGINGEMAIVDGSLADLNGRVLGNGLTGKAVVVVNFDSTSPEQGTLDLYALAGSEIRKFAFGGVPLHADEVCFVE